MEVSSVVDAPVLKKGALAVVDAASRLRKEAKSAAASESKDGDSDTIVVASLPRQKVSSAVNAMPMSSVRLPKGADAP